MPTREQVEYLADQGRYVSALVGKCEPVALAQIEAGEQWHTPNGVFTVSDYERVRRRILQVVRATTRELRLMRRASPEPEFIQMHAALTQLKKCCESCPAKNLGQAKRTGFECVYRKKTRQAEIVPLRFRLGEDGRIVQQH